MTSADLVAEIRAEFAARPELAAALRRAERPSPPSRRRQRPQRPEPPAVAPEPAARRRRWHCGWGGYLCPVTLAARGLCNEHAAIIDALGPLESGRPARAGRNPAPKLPPAQTIDPADVFDAGDRTRVPAVERAAHMARWIARIGGPVRRADAARIAGIHPEAGTMRGVLAAGVDRCWIVRDAGGAGSVLPGDVAPNA
jgi:hypothetical protein